MSPSNQPRINVRKSLAKQLNVDLSSSISKYSKSDIMIIGHRGCPYDEVENTLEGFRRTASLSLQQSQYRIALELDVFVLACGTLVVFHGGDNDPSQPGAMDDYIKGNKYHGSIMKYTWKEIEEKEDFELDPSCPEFKAALDMSSSTLTLDKIAAARIPTLESVLRMIQQEFPTVVVKIELKGPNTAKPVLELVRQLQMQQQCQYSAYDLSQIEYIRNEEPTAITGALFGGIDPPHDYISQAKAVGASEIHLQYDACTASRLDTISKEGMQCMAWFRGPFGMSRDDECKYLETTEVDMCPILLAAGVRYLCVDRPHALAELLLGRRKEQ